MTARSYPTIFLASTSVYRQQLLAKLIPVFNTQKPDVDETPLIGESAEQLVKRLALAKAQAVDRKSVV